MRRITIKRARTWHYRKMRPCIEQSNDLALLSPFPFWLGCIINTSGYDFRKGQLSVPFVCAFSVGPGGPKARVGPTLERKRGRERASRAISGWGHAYSTFRAYRFSHQWRSVYAMNLPRTSRLVQLRNPEQRAGRRVAGPYEFSLPGNVGGAAHKNSRWGDRCCYKWEISGKVQTWNLSRRALAEVLSRGLHQRVF